MANGMLKTFAQGVALALAYAGIFVGAWHLSVDQWYLPAGLRFIALFLIPRRWIPYALAGDIMATMYLRVTLAHQSPDDEFPLTWAYISPFLLALTLFGARALLKRMLDVEYLPKTLPISALAFAVLAKGLNVVVNLSLSGPPFGTSAQQFISSVIGDYLGILLLVLPWGILQYRHHWFAPMSVVLKQTGTAVGLVLCLYGSVVITGAHGTAVQLLPLIFMTLPAVYLTVLYGWNGAAVGCVVVNLGIALALPRTGILGAFDGVVLLAQAALCVASIVLLAVGGHITRLSRQFNSAFAELERKSEALTQSKDLARNAFTSAEGRLRHHALMLAAARSNLDGFRHDVVSTLKASGLSGAAFDATLKGRAAIDEIAQYGDEIYPFEIENYGLYAVLLSDNFAKRFGPDIKLRHQLLGESPKMLPVTQRLAVYRGICAAIEVMHKQHLVPKDINIKVRVWKRKRLIGTIVEIQFKGGGDGTACFADRMSELENLISAYGGTVKYRHARGIAFVLSDEEEAASDHPVGQVPVSRPMFQPAR